MYFLFEIQHQHFLVATALLLLEAGRSDFKYDFTPKEVRVGKACLESRQKSMLQVKC